MELTKSDPPRVRPSNTYRDCWGWLGMAQIYDCRSPESNFAEMGKELHRALEANDTTDLDEHDAALVERCREFQRKVAPVDPGDFSAVEERLKLGVYLEPGTIDFLRVRGVDATIIDWKFGYKIRSAFWQLLAYCLSVLESYVEVERVKAYVFYPRLGFVDSIEVTRAEIADLSQALVDRIARYSPGERPWEDLHPSPANCEFCPAKAVCPALARDVQRGLADCDSVQMTMGQRVRLLELEAVAKPLFKENREFVKDILASGGEIPGWRLQERRGKRYIKDVAAALALLSKHAIPATDIIKSLPGTPVVKRLAEAIHEKNGGTKKGAEEAAAAILSELLKESDPIQALTRES